MGEQLTNHCLFNDFGNKRQVANWSKILKNQIKDSLFKKWNYNSTFPAAKDPSFLDR